eukprot:TRINITY_DN31229_c0_g1_i1.p1 TRINITY_DN31229_c0_g1~~TRINITY_DN31229_c0_g1_i1.p1  ORF type:complete len:478 (+),score=41.63 TRINITY_DN31229_c0_g1_i1:177-1436(+)
MDCPLLLRHIAHVCAWIALAHPLEAAAHRNDKTNLSPVTVLSTLLGICRRKRLDDRVRQALDAVRSCCEVVLGSQSEACEHTVDWKMLCDQLPTRQRKRKLNDMSTPSPKDIDSCASIYDIDKLDVVMLKRVERLNRCICKWQQRDLDDNIAASRDIEERLERILAAETIDTVALRKVLYELVGALSPPRLLPSPCAESLPMDELTALNLRKSAALQRRIRNMLLTGILTWRSQLQLEDEQIDPLLSRVGAFISHFEKMHSSDIRQACSWRQWKKLYAASASSSDDGIDAVGTSDGKSAAGQRHHVRQGKASAKDGVYTPSASRKRLKYVEHRPSEEFTVRYGTCGHEIKSAWWFVRPGFPPRVLVPQNGHKIPMPPTGKVCGKYRRVDGGPTFSDLFANLDICEHNQQIGRASCRERV